MSACRCLTQFTIEEAFYDKQWREVVFMFRGLKNLTSISPSASSKGNPPFTEKKWIQGHGLLFRGPISHCAIHAWVDVGRRARCSAHCGRSEGMFIPNAFTPDGDALNDVWRWSMPEGATAEVLIFNRTGHPVWSGQMASSGAQGWSGTL